MAFRLHIQKREISILPVLANRSSSDTGSYSISEAHPELLSVRIFITMFGTIVLH
jgi:hypothetical protein